QGAPRVDRHRGHVHRAHRRHGRVRARPAQRRQDPPGRHQGRVDREALLLVRFRHRCRFRKGQGRLQGTREVRARERRAEADLGSAGEVRSSAEPVHLSLPRGWFEGSAPLPFVGAGLFCRRGTRRPGRRRDHDMGICYWDAKMLWEARAQGGRFDATLTVGRQALNLHPREVAEFRRLHADAVSGAASAGASGDTSAAASRVSGILRDYTFYDFADDFLREALDVRQLDVMDYSGYEGAAVIHDLNQPVPVTLHERYDAVIDGGALEHIFNFPVAVSNLMNMTKPGGRLFLFLPANNLCGHGFYQFSPELMFRVFTERNGFATERVILWESAYPGVETTPAGVAYDVT